MIYVIKKLNIVQYNNIYNLNTINIIIMNNYKDIVDELTNFKLLILNNIDKYENELLPNLKKFENQFILNNFIPFISIDKIDEFCKKSVNMYDYQFILIPLIYEGYNGYTTIKSISEKPNTINDNLHTSYYDTSGGRYMSLINYNKNNLIINEKNFLELLKLNINDFILYFDDDYKKKLIINDGLFNNNIDCIIYTNYNFKIEIEFMNLRLYDNNDKYLSVGNYNDHRINSKCKTINDFTEILKINKKDKSPTRIEINYLEKKTIFIDKNIMYGENLFLHFIKCKFINLDTNESIEFVNNTIDNVLLENFLTKCKKEYHPKILFDYLRNQSIDEMKQFLNQIDNYNKFNYETKIEELKQNIKINENIIEDNKEKYNILINGNIIIQKKCKEQENENKELIKELNKIKKEQIINQKKFNNLEKMYNDLLENDLSDSDDKNN